MDKITKYVKFFSGSPQFRLKESQSSKAPTYIFYNQSHLEEDLSHISKKEEDKRIKTLDDVSLLHCGDIVFSLISGTAAIVQKNHHQYLYTQNYVKLVPDKKLDSAFLVYLLNENQEIRRQLLTSLQGSQVLKYTLKQIQSLSFPKLPDLPRQQLMGSVYLSQLRLQELRIRTAKVETQRILAILREEMTK